MMPMLMNGARVLGALRVPDGPSLAGAAAGAGKGCAVGMVVGGVLGCVTHLCEAMLFERTDPVTYRDRAGRLLSFRDVEKRPELREGLAMLHRYKRYDEAAWDGAALFEQRIVDLEGAFRRAREAGGDALRHIARLQVAAMRADALWRRLFRSVRAAGDAIGAEEAARAAGDLHELHRLGVAAMRDRFHASPQLSPKAAGRRR